MNKVRSKTNVELKYSLKIDDALIGLGYNHDSVQEKWYRFYVQCLNSINRSHKFEKNIHLDAIYSEAIIRVSVL